MPDIITKEVVKGTVKTLDRASTVAQHVKSAYQGGCGKHGFGR